MTRRGLSVPPPASHCQRTFPPWNTLLGRIWTPSFALQTSRSLFPWGYVAPDALSISWSPGFLGSRPCSVFIFCLVTPQSLRQVHACWVSRVWLSATARTVAHQAPLSMGFSRREHWSGCHFFSRRSSQPGDWTDVSLCLFALAGRFFTTSATWQTGGCNILTFWLSLLVNRHQFCHYRSKSSFTVYYLKTNSFILDNYIYLNFLPLILYFFCVFNEHVLCTCMCTFLLI